jgi:hypothetical protein
MSNSKSKKATQLPGPRWAFLTTAIVMPLLLAGCSSPSAPEQRAVSSPTSDPVVQQPPATTASASKESATNQVDAASAPDPSLVKMAREFSAVASAPFEGEGWRSMFDGQTLTGWRETPFAGHAEAQCVSGLILLNMGNPFTGLNWTNELPKMNYEVALDAMRVMGSDFFCGLTVPVGNSFCSLIVGGWGGSLVGISSLDGMDASENETTKYVNFEPKRWYRIRLRVTEGRIEGWIDKEKLVDVKTTDRKISLRPGEIELSKPFGIACWQTTSALREIKIRQVDKPADPPKKI